MKTNSSERLYLTEEQNHNKKDDTMKSKKYDKVFCKITKKELEKATKKELDRILALISKIRDNEETINRIQKNIKYVGKYFKREENTIDKWLTFYYIRKMDKEGWLIGDCIQMQMSKRATDGYNIYSHGLGWDLSNSKEIERDEYNAGFKMFIDIVNKQFTRGSKK